MTRQQASKLTRDLLDSHGLEDWHIRLTIDLTKPFLGLCSGKDKCIILNAHHIDTHPDVEVIDTIRHEVAHAIVGTEHGHNDIWKAKAVELGAAPTICSTMSLDPHIINAIRSGAEVKVEFTEETIVHRTPKYTVTRLQDKCETCGKVAKASSVDYVKTSTGRKKITTLECHHIVITDAESNSAFEDIVFDGDPTCKHTFGKGKSRTICTKCNAKRLYEYQIEGARFLEIANGRAALFDEQGLGKTIQALAYLKFHEKDAWPYLWVTKSGIKIQHVKEIIRIIGKHAFPQILSKGTDTLIPGLAGYVCSYDIFRRLPNINMFKEAGVKTIILDECQAIKNPDSSRTQSVRKVVQGIPKVIPTSGTPWKNRGSEFYVVLNMLDPKLFYDYEAFKRNDVAYYYEGNKEKEGGIRNPTEFKKKIAHIAIRRERKDVMPELPLISRRQLVLEVPEHAKKVYQEQEDELVKFYNQALIDGDEDSFETQKKIMENLIIMRQIVGLAKVDGTVEFIEEFLEETERKHVVFVHHKEVGLQVYNRLRNWCLDNKMAPPLTLTADMDSASRFEVQEKFNSQGYRLMIASTLASGEGLNLQTCSDCTVMERQWNPANEEQVEGRFIRIGQLAQAVTATYVHGDGTIDTILDKIVENKRREFINSMNKEGSYIPTWDQSNIVAQLMQGILLGRKK